MRTLEYHVDEQYIPTFEMQMAAGRNFSTEFKTDSSAIIINESAAKAFGWGTDAIGKKDTTAKTKTRRSRGAKTANATEAKAAEPKVEEAPAAEETAAPEETPEA